ncbi:MAG: hypothetical protein EA384_03705 [Spirochaetaceae bacterium]|nr:MAG: hypothetical protein EA384_03705 [Spirochaetaceae bacterium]
MKRAVLIADKLHMKHPICLMAAVLLTGAAAAAAQTDMLTLQNEEEAAFFFTVVRRDGEQYQRMTESLAGVLEVLRDAVELEYMVPPRGVSPQRFSASDRYLVGVFVEPGSTAYPAAAVALPPGAGTVFISRDQIMTDAAGRELRVRPWSVSLGDEPVLLDNRYVDWEPILPLVRFARPLSQPRFVLEEGAGRQPAVLSRSQFWGRGGTELDTLKAIAGDRAVYLMASTHSRIAPGMSLFLFGYRNRDDRQALYTVEVPVGEPSGPVLLWVAGSDQPKVVGRYVSDAFMFEADLRYDLLPSALFDVPVNSAFVEVATGYSGAGRHEEFYHARIYLSSIEGI